MNIEIKFRGWFQCITGRGYWVYGYPTKQENGNWEITYDSGISFTVENIDQFIGITDSMDKEIFTGDIVIDLKSQKYTVEFNNEFCAFFLYPVDDRESFMGIYPNIVLSILGNIDENPELLK